MNNVNNAGYTLLETMFSLMIIALVSFLCLNLVLELKTIDNSDNPWRNFVLVNHSLFVDWKQSGEINIANNMINFKYSNDKVVNYYCNNDELIRQVNNQGYEIVMIKLDNCAIAQGNLTLEVNGEKNTFNLEQRFE